MPEIKKPSTNAFDQIFSKDETTETSVNNLTSQQVNTFKENKKPSAEKYNTMEYLQNTVDKVNKTKSQTVKLSTVQQPDMSTSRVVAGSNNEKIGRTLKNGKVTKAKTFFLEQEIIEMFKFIKFKQKIDESKYANQILNEFFTQQFGQNWRNKIQ